MSDKSKISLFASAEKRNAVVCLLLAAATLALYNPVNSDPFVNDVDVRYVTENTHVQQGLTRQTVVWALTSMEVANWHPLTWMSHALDCSLFHLNPAGHHFTSVLLHTVNVVLLFLLLIWATECLGPSLFAAVLFALHPINVESVAWIAERKNVLCTTFFLLALWAYGWYAQKPGWKRYLAVAALFIAALAAKAMVITLPFVLLLADYWPLNRVAAPGRESEAMPASTWPRLVGEKIPLFFVSAADAIVTMQAQQASGAVRSSAQFSLAIRLADAIYAYGMYLWKMIWPARLAPLYPHPGDSLAARQVAAAALILVGISILVFRFRSHRYLVVGWLWFLGTLVPVIGLVQVGDAAMADRYAYIPLIGLFIMIAFGLADIAQHTKLGWWQGIPATVVILALALATHRQIGYWQSSYDLWSHTLAVTENNFIAEDNLGGALILEGKEEVAHPYFEAAARINPRDPLSRSNLGTYAQTHHRLREAIADYQQAIDLTSDHGLRAQNYANLGAAQRELGEDEAARDSFEQSLVENPSQFNAWIGLGLLAQKQGNLAEAVSDLSRSVELRPTAQGYYELGRSLALSGRSGEALDAYQQALKLSPDFTEAQHGADVLGQPKR